MTTYTDPRIFPTPAVIDVQDAIGNMQYNYAWVLLICGVFVAFYVLWNNFVRYKSTSEKIIKFSHDLDEYALMPALFIAIIGISYFTGFRGF